MLFLKKRKKKRKYVARPGIEPRTPDLRVRCPINCATRPGFITPGPDLAPYCLLRPVCPAIQRLYGMLFGCPIFYRLLRYAFLTVSLLKPFTNRACTKGTSLVVFLMGKHRHSINLISLPKIGFPFCHFICLF